MQQAPYVLNFESIPKSADSILNRVNRQIGDFDNVWTSVELMLVALPNDQVHLLQRGKKTDRSDLCDNR